MALSDVVFFCGAGGDKGSWSALARVYDAEEHGDGALDHDVAAGIVVDGGNDSSAENKL